MANLIHQSEWVNFTAKELACPCCGKSEMNIEFMDRVQQARTECRMPFIVVAGGGCRCEKFQTSLRERGLTKRVKSRHVMLELGDSINTQDIGCRAIDITFKTSKELARILFSLYDEGITSFAISKDKKFVHVDNCETPHIGLY